MSARTDRIAKLTGLIESCASQNSPNKLANLTQKRDQFESWTDDKYDYQMALAAWIIETKKTDTQEFNRLYYTQQ